MRKYQKHCRDLLPEMVYIDYGLSVLDVGVIHDMVAPGVPVDLAVVFEKLSREGHLAGYEASERFYEIGSADGLRRLEKHLAH